MAWSLHYVLVRTPEYCRFFKYMCYVRDTRAFGVADHHATTALAVVVDKALMYAGARRRRCVVSVRR